jgi:hypothetical protein
MSDIIYGKNKYFIFCYILFLTVLSLTFIVKYSNAVTKLEKHNINFTYPREWEKRSEQTFPWRAGEFIDGWAKEVSGGSACILVLIQSPGYTISEKEYSGNMIQSLTNRGATILQRQVEMVAGSTAYWVSAVSNKGTGKSIEGGKIPTRSTWVAVPNGPDIIIFYFSAPEQDYDVLLSDFKSFLNSVTISRLPEIPRSDLSKMKNETVTSQYKVKESTTHCPCEKNLVALNSKEFEKLKKEIEDLKNKITQLQNENYKLKEKTLPQDTQINSLPLQIIEITPRKISLSKTKELEYQEGSILKIVKNDKIIARIKISKIRENILEAEVIEIKDEEINFDDKVIPE